MLGPSCTKPTGTEDGQGSGGGGPRVERRPWTEATSSGLRPAPLPEVAGPQAAVTVGYVAAVAPSLAVVRELDLLHDDAIVQFLLQQSLLARAQEEEEEEARELEEVKRMEEAVTKMQRLEAEVMLYAGRDRSQLSDLEYAAVTLVALSDALRRRRERRKKRKKQRKKKLPRAPRPRCRRPCVHQRQVPAVRSSVVTQRQVPTVHSFMLPVQFLDTVFDMPVVVLRQVPGLMVQKTVVRPQLPSIFGRRHSFSSSRGSSPWSRLFTRPQRFRSCCFGRRCPCCAGSCRFSGAAVEKTLALPQLQLAGKSVPCYVPLYLAVTRSVFAFGVQDFGLFWVMTSGNVCVFSAYCFNTGYMSTSVYGGFWEIFNSFLCQGGPRMVQFSDKVVEVPVVVQRQVPQFRSCSSSRSLTPLFLRSG